MDKDALSRGITDEGECLFNTDLDRGKVAVTIRAPLTLDKRTVEIGITELIEIAAHVTLKSIEYQREMRARLMAKTTA